MNRLYRYIPLMTIVIIIVAMAACSTKKNTAGTRFWQAFNTRYNVYYNGITHYNEQIKVLENDYLDDYSQHVFIHPAEAYQNPKSPQPSSNFDRTIEKMQKAISLHSIKRKPKRKSGKGNDEKYKEWLKREEYNPFIHNAWYTMGKAQYMKGDFTSSAATFHYIARHFGWLPDLVTESQVWEALSYCAMGWTTEADNVLSHVHVDRIEDKRVRSIANLAFADYYIKLRRSQEAIPYLAEAVKGAKGAQKVRLNFLLGQLYEETGQKDLAYEAFKKAGSSSGSTYRTKFNARIKQSAVFAGNNIESEVKSLRSMTRYDRNKDYLDQIYFAIGNLYLSQADTAKAVENYVKAAEKSTRNGIDKAISQLTLGGVYFDQHKYDLAQPCYSEAIPQLSEDYPNYKMLKKRSDVLDELAVYAQNVTLQDSLLKLSEMPLEEQQKVIKKIIDELKKKEKEEQENAQREEYLAQQSAKGNQLANKGQTSTPQTYNINNDKSWYFYNTTTKNAGKTQFQQQWGNRKLEDDWRRRNKNTFSLNENDGDNRDGENNGNDSIAMGNDSTQVDQEALKRAEDPHFEEYYLKQIPKTDEEKQNAHDIIQEGLYNMGIILKDKLEDYDAAAFQFNTLNSRYPDNIYRLDVYYNLYLLYMRSGRPEQAEYFRQQILTDFADSKYGIAMQDPDYLENLKRMDEVQEAMYARAYQAYLNNDNEAVHAAYAEMMRRYPLSKIMPKFMFIDALSYVTQRNSDKFKSTLKEMLERYPQTDITPTASAMMKQLNAGRKLHGGSANARGMLWTTRLSNDTTAAEIEKKFTPFTEGKDKPQHFVLIYSTDTVSPNQLLYEVAKHNFSTYTAKDFDLELMNFDKLGLLIVKGFVNYADVAQYRTQFEQDENVYIPDGVHYVIISKENFDLLLNEGRSFQDYFMYLEEQNSEDVEGQIPDEADDDETLDDDHGTIDGDIPANGGEEDDGLNKSVKKTYEDEGTPTKGDKKADKKADKNSVKTETSEKTETKPEKTSEKTETKPEKTSEKTKKSDKKTDKKSEKKSEGETQTGKLVTKKSTEQGTDVPVTPPVTAKPIPLPEEPKPFGDLLNTPTTPKKTKAVAPANSVEADSVVKIGNLVEPTSNFLGTDTAVIDSVTTSPATMVENNIDMPMVKPKKTNEGENDIKRLKKHKDDERKAQEKAEKERQKQAKKEQKEREANKAREDSVKNAQKAREDQADQERDRQEQAQKQREQDRKQSAKQKEQERKQRIEERKQRQKEREAQRKEEAKRKKKEAEERKKAAKQKQKEREKAAKERKKQREQERKANKK